MPIYEYECAACSQITEAVQRFSDPPLTECAHCHGQMRKLISKSTFHLKGSGWYVTDYSGKNQSTAATGSSSSPTSKDSSESSKVEAKSASSDSCSTTTSD
ncbi:MAG TPA: FmdB family transcriptional regulator [Syntrophobacteraceae bacterium]|nr:FmdB family transcriptional regulator [Syntrophobacteraceae bacterium]HBD06962.1 FmdB family transcriptional regulator [Syntrophobacteraceae bacterium]HBZ53787.1 FmdB family transcriptional regulator [Syntrophobacteraceae bacterium]